MLFCGLLLGVCSPPPHPFFLVTIIITQVFSIFWRISKLNTSSNSFGLGLWWQHMATEFSKKSMNHKSSSVDFPQAVGYQVFSINQFTDSTVIEFHYFSKKIKNKSLNKQHVHTTAKKKKEKNKMWANLIITFMQTCVKLQHSFLLFRAVKNLVLK